jgi:Tripartite tricarboxylate transporter family receptor
VTNRCQTWRPATSSATRVFDVATVLGLKSSAGVPPTIVAKLQSAVAKILREPDIAERLKTLGILIAIGVLVMIAVLWWLY